MIEVLCSGNWYYTIEENEITLCGRSDDKPDLIIPEFIEGLPVRRIGDRAFREQKITSLILPQGLVSIGYEAFFDHHIRYLHIPDSVNSIKREAFSHICQDLFRSVSINADVEMGRKAIGENFTEFYQRQGKQAGVFYFKNENWYSGNVIDDDCIEDSSSIPEVKIDPEVKIEKMKGIIPRSLHSSITEAETVIAGEQRYGYKRFFMSVAATLITIAGVFASFIIAPYYLIRAFRSVLKNRKPKKKMRPEAKPETPVPLAPDSKPAAIISDGYAEVFGMKFPLITKGWSHPYYYFSGELEHFPIEPVIISYMGRNIPVCGSMYLNKDGVFRGAVIYKGYNLEYKGRRFKICGVIFFHPNGQPERFTVDEEAETDFIVDGKKLVLHRFDTVVLYESNGCPRTVIRSISCLYSKAGNWLDIAENGDVTGCFHERREHDDYD